MRRAVVVVAAMLACVAVGAARADAQDAPPPIGPFVVDVRGTIPRFPNTDALAASRGLGQDELPGSGFGLDIDAQVYPLRWKAVTFGIGGQLTLGGSHSEEVDSDGLISSRAVTERLTSIAPQISFNFGTGNGWSYLSGGVGVSVWSVVPAATASLPADAERLQTVNYGGGARWFMKRHLAFTFDVRFYQINPGTSVFGYPASPRTTMLIFGAGISIK